MGWVRIDDHFDEHPKMVQVGPTVWGVWLASLAYANRNLTDGFIPDGQVRRLTAFEGVRCAAVTKVLVGSALWDRVDGGYRIHDYEQYQPTKAEVLESRAKTADRIARWRERNAGNGVGNGVTHAVTNGVGNGVGNGVSNTAPKPKPNPKEKNNRNTTAADAAHSFDEFWSKYPKRTGGNPKPRAEKAWNARIREGIDPADLISGVGRYATYVEATGKAGSEFVMQAATFLGPDRRWEESWEVGDRDTDDDGWVDQLQKDLI